MQKRLDILTLQNWRYLKKFTGKFGKIKPIFNQSLSRKDHKRLVKLIKQARILSLLPTIKSSATAI
jgi:ribosomal protein S18